MLGQTEAFPQNEWAGLPLRSNGEETRLWDFVDRSPAQWIKDNIRSRGLSLPPRRDRQQRRRQALTLMAFGTLAVTYAVLRCAIQRFPNRKAGDEPRSLVGGKRVQAPEACLGVRGSGFEKRGARSEKPSDEELQHRASGFMNSFVRIMKANEPVLAQIPVHKRSKILSLLLTLVVQELAALATVLDDSSRDTLVQTVREVGIVTNRLGTTITRRTGGACSRRLQLFLGKVLRRLELSGPQGSLLPRTERLQKLSDLLRLQEVMLVNLREVFDDLVKGFSAGGDPSDDDLNAAKDKLGDLLHVRKEQIFLDPQLSWWLLDGENQTKRFAVASSAHVQLLRQRRPPTVEEMIEELTTLSARRREQRVISQQSTLADASEAYAPERADLTSSGSGSQATELPRGLFTDPLMSGQLFQWSSVDARNLTRGYNREEPLEDVFFGAALGEPTPMAETQESNAEEAISSPFSLPDMFDYLRGRLSTSP
ncbi:uncharacterized protein EMH_0021450 [Eimeria mitis]|uniref:Transmembrane protein n=1 Tax=Eimeria mitis TaxID=44415 RepID=U6KK13_9EIME|nr:uncharacterized protein EMH_0021450 [Eimeria mitis]CDJ36612.1 hypothetical protein, conserved [Eimeria mitis]